MRSPIIKLLFLLAIPVAVSVIAGYPVTHFTDRDKFPATTEPASKPLNLRCRGYSANEAVDYWTWLRTNDALVAEQRFLKADLFFPFFYCGSILASLVLAWNWLMRPFNRTWLVIPVVLTAIADWIENLVHLRQLMHFVRREPLDASWIQVASIATITKWTFLAISSFALLSLGVWLLSYRKVYPSELIASPEKES